MFANRLKTVILLGSMSGLLLLLGNLLGGSGGIQAALLIALAMNTFAYFYSDKMVLKMYGAKPLEQTGHEKIYADVEHIAKVLKIPMPKLWVVDTPVANAFATGRNPHHSSVAITTGLMGLLDRSELDGVLAHELSHIKNRDTLVATIAATMATAIGYIAYTLRFSSLFSSGNRRRGNQFAMLLVGLLMPIAATMIQMAISRSREYMADETGARASGNPLALASALQKLHQKSKYAHFSGDDTAKTSTAHMFIMHPFSGGSWGQLFSTHPPVSQRIQRLQAMYEKIAIV